jgi:hypothetical protein
LAEKPEEKRPLGRPRRRWEDTVKIYDGFRWLGIGFCVNYRDHCNVTSGSVKSGMSIDQLSDYQLLEMYFAHGAHGDSSD